MFFVEKFGSPCNSSSNLRTNFNLFPYHKSNEDLTCPKLPSPTTCPNVKSSGLSFLKLPEVPRGFAGGVKLEEEVDFILFSIGTSSFFGVLESIGAVDCGVDLSIKRKLNIYLLHKSNLYRKLPIFPTFQ